MVPPAPPRLSMMMVCPSCCDSGSVTMRPMMSMVLPPEKGTTARITRSFGQVSAQAVREIAGAASAAEASVRKRRRLGGRMSFLVVFVRRMGSLCVPWRIGADHAYRGSQREGAHEKIVLPHRENAPFNPIVTAVAASWPHAEGSRAEDGHHRGAQLRRRRGLCLCVRSPPADARSSDKRHGAHVRRRLHQLLVGRLSRAARPRDGGLQLHG